jgi:hypothetical protein
MNIIPSGIIDYQKISIFIIISTIVFRKLGMKIL